MVLRIIKRDSLPRYLNVKQVFCQYVHITFSADHSVVQKSHLRSIGRDYIEIKKLNFHLYCTISAHQSTNDLRHMKQFSKFSTCGTHVMEQGRKK